MPAIGYCVCKAHLSLRSYAYFVKRAMSFYRDRIYPRLVSKLGDPKPIREVRQQIIPWAQAEVLEIGVGSGINFVHYDPARVSKIYGLEPNPGMIRLANREGVADEARYSVPGPCGRTHPFRERIRRYGG